MVKELEHDVRGVQCFQADEYTPEVSGVIRSISQTAGRLVLVVLFLPTRTMTFRGGSKTAEVTDAQVFLAGSGLEKNFSNSVSS